MKHTIALSLLFLVSACSDARFARATAAFGKAEVTCYSGGTKIFSGTSTGKVSSSENSDGYYFVDSSDGKLKEVSGECVVVYE